MSQTPEVPVPKEWHEVAKSGLVHAVALARIALLQVLSGFENGRSPRARLFSEVERLGHRVRALQTELAIKDRRMAKLAPPKRPHYSPEDRLQILLLQAASGWSLAATAQRFLVTTHTLGNWKQKLDDAGEAAVVRLAQPVNRFPDQVRQLVRDLKRLYPSMGRQRIADILARTGLVVAASTVRRMLHETPAAPPAPPESSPQSDVATQTLAEVTDAASCENTAQPEPSTPKGVTARYMHHVWHCDLTLVPTAAGFWGAVVALCCVARMALCVLGGRRRRPILQSAHPAQGIQATSLGARRAPVPQRCGQAGGARSSASYQRPRRPIPPGLSTLVRAKRHQATRGAIGEHGSIAIIERFWRSMKVECCKLLLVPLRLQAFQAELDCYAAWFRTHRPHQGLGGRTPQESREETIPTVVRLEPRAKMSIRGDSDSVRSVTSVKLRVTPFAGKTHLPIVEVQAA